MCGGDVLRYIQKTCVVCRNAHVATPTEKLYQIEHPRLVTLFDEVSHVEEGERGYWISKAWLKGTSDRS